VVAAGLPVAVGCGQVANREDGRTRDPTSTRVRTRAGGIFRRGLEGPTWEGSFDRTRLSGPNRDSW
jgi:hypothetical protein